MSDLETQLRTMLAERARDVTTVPAHVTDPADAATGPEYHRRPRNARLWLVAAAVVAVLAVAGGAVLLGRSSTHDTAPVGPTRVVPSSSAHSSAAPTPVSPHAARDVRLSWFGMAAVSGYTTLGRTSEPGVRTLVLHRRGDQGAPPGCNGCQTVSKSAQVLVYDAGRFRRSGGWTRTTVAGHAAYLGTTLWAGRYPVPSLAWEYAPNAWTVVQGLTDAANSTVQLRRIAAAVRPAQDIPIELPFRLGYVPGLPIVRIEDERPDYALVISFGTGTDREVDITLWSTRELTGRFDTTGATPRTIGGLPGYLSPQEGFAVPYHDGLVVVGSQGNGADSLRRIADGLTWTNGDGRAPLVPMEQAIP